MSHRLATVAALALLPACATADESLFKDKIAPLLSQRCLSCHHGTKARGGLDLSTKAALLKGGDRGPAIDRDSVADSPLLDAVRGPKPKMPRTGEPLSAAQVANLTKWVEAGAPWPAGITLKAELPKPSLDWWSLKPVARPAIPVVKDTKKVRNPVDAFLLARLEASGLTFAPEADRRTLIRRLTFDLHGLPPTPEEIDAFVKDDDSKAYEKLVDRLLASPRYGERWGRHWLDVVHYADTHGYDKDKRRPNAWPYRDYVIRAFNEDKPYSRFVKEQIAGDVLYPGDADALSATGFLVAGPWDFVGHVELREGTVEKEKTRVLDRDDIVSSTLGTFNSLTVHCARCHDHKFDPIPQKDYYRLQAVFAGIDRGDRTWSNVLTHLRRAALEQRRTELMQGLKELPKAEQDRLRAELKQVEAGLAKLPAPRVVFAAVPVVSRTIRLLNRGEVEQPGEAIGPGALSCVTALDHDFKLSDAKDEGARRAALAAWIVDPKNPLTRRSIVNRLWQYHFGRGLVDTPSDFGRNGGRPTHPELLDWLAEEFVKRGESFKTMHRLLVTSAAYRQSSRYDAKAAALDADNRLLWRMNRSRLDAESVRDAVLAVGGKLDLKTGGPGFELFRFKDDHSPIYDHADLEKIHDPATYRRTVYRFTVRSVPNPFLDCLDAADPNANTPVRNTTLTALQALALLNDPFMVRQAEHFAARLEKASDDPKKRIKTAFLLAFGRPPDREERDNLAAYAKKHGLANACRLLFNANEFVFID
jgi:hypothetical protein